MARLKAMDELWTFMVESTVAEECALGQHQAESHDHGNRAQCRSLGQSSASESGLDEIIEPVLLYGSRAPSNPSCYM